MILVKLGLKNLMRNFRRSLITVMSIGWGLAVILWLQAILNGSNHNIIDTITSTYYGHMQIFRKDYVDQKLVQQNFTWDEKLLPQLPGTTIYASPRVHLPALISSGEQSTPIMLDGIDPLAEPHITRIKDSLVKGEFLQPEPTAECTSHDAYVSTQIAKLLGVDVGQKVVVLAQAADGSMGNELFRIKGLFSTGSPDYDRGIMLTTTPCVFAIGALKGIHEVALKVEGSSTPEEVEQLIKAKLPDNMLVQTWRQGSPRLAAMLVYNDASLILVSVMLFIVISLGILNTFLVTVFERTKEFGVMMALGTPGRGIIGTVLCEAFFLGTCASILGIVGGGAVIAYHAHSGFNIQPLVGSNFSIGAFKMSLLIHPVMNWIGAIKATLATILVVVISSFYPAFRASRLRPAEAIRSQ